MVVKQSHLVIALFLILLVAGLAVARGAVKLDSRASKKDVRGVAVENCERSSERTALLAAFLRNTGDPTNKALAVALVATIPGAPRAHIADVEKVENERSHAFTFALAPDAKALQTAGCQTAADAGQ